MTTTRTVPLTMRPRVLFVGSDASSPQIAASLLLRAAGDRVEVSTAGTRDPRPNGRCDEMLVAMGLDLADEKRLSSGALHAADRVVILGADLDVARLPGPRYEEWDLVHEDLVGRVEALINDFTVVTAVPRPAVRDRLRRLGSSLAFLRRNRDDLTSIDIR